MSAPRFPRLPHPTLPLQRGDMYGRNFLTKGRQKQKTCPCYKITREGEALPVGWDCEKSQNLPYGVAGWALLSVSCKFLSPFRLLRMRSAATSPKNPSAFQGRHELASRPCYNDVAQGGLPLLSFRGKRRHCVMPFAPQFAAHAACAERVKAARL